MTRIQLKILIAFMKIKIYKELKSTYLPLIKLKRIKNKNNKLKYLKHQGFKILIIFKINSKKNRKDIDLQLKIIRMMKLNLAIHLVIHQNLKKMSLIMMILNNRNITLWRKNLFKLNKTKIK